ncbi:MAG: hypothetical protein H0V09_07440 [Gemmatimonadetes bacterium]|nr:hypothetical protein [Gemmatimonadota bacterium]
MAPARPRAEEATAPAGRAAGDEGESPPAEGAGDRGAPVAADAGGLAETTLTREADFARAADGESEKLSRFEWGARRALADRDRDAALRSLVLWQDTLQLGRRLDPARRYAAAALADSLAAFMEEPR